MSAPVVVHIYTDDFGVLDLLRNARLTRGQARVIFHVTGLVPNQTDAFYLKERPELMGDGIERAEVITGECGCP